MARLVKKIAALSVKFKIAALSLGFGGVSYLIFYVSYLIFYGWKLHNENHTLYDLMNVMDLWRSDGLNHRAMDYSIIIAIASAVYFSINHPNYKRIVEAAIAVGLWYGTYYIEKKLIGLTYDEMAFAVSVAIASAVYFSINHPNYKRMALISFGLGIGTMFISKGFIGVENTFEFGLGVAIISAIIFRLRPELLAALYKKKPDDQE